MNLNEVARYSFIVEIDLHEDITKEQIKRMKRQLALTADNINDVLCEKLLWKSNANFIGARGVNKT